VLIESGRDDERAAVCEIARARKSAVNMIRNTIAPTTPMSWSTTLAKMNRPPNVIQAREIRPRPVMPTAVTCILPRASRSMPSAASQLSVKTPTPNAQPAMSKPASR